MKILLPFVACAIGFSAKLVSAGFITPGPLHSWQDYCKENGVHQSEPHVCFEGEADVVKDLPADAKFTGYRSSVDPNKFVILSTQENVSIDTERFTLIIKRTTVFGKEDCAWVILEGFREAEGYYYDTKICQPGGESVKLAKFLAVGQRNYDPNIDAPDAGPDKNTGDGGNGP